MNKDPVTPNPNIVSPFQRSDMDFNIVSDTTNSGTEDSNSEYISDQKKRVTWFGLDSNVPTRTTSRIRQLKHRGKKKRINKARDKSCCKNVNTDEKSFERNGERMTVVPYRTGNLLIYRGSNPRVGKFASIA